MNAEDRGMDEITDVLSYPAWSREEAALLGLHVPERNTDFLPPPFPGGVQQQEIGRLILCPSRIAQDAAHVYHVDFESNLMFVSVHGMCHLLGSVSPPLLLLLVPEVLIPWPRRCSPHPSDDMVTPLNRYDHEDPEDEKAMKAREKEIWDGLVLELESHA